MVDVASRLGATALATLAVSRRIAIGITAIVAIVLRLVLPVLVVRAPRPTATAGVMDGATPAVSTRSAIGMMVTAEIFLKLAI